jgi:hypothetical protein
LCAVLLLISNVLNSKKIQLSVQGFIVLSEVAHGQFQQILKKFSKESAISVLWTRKSN